MDTGVIYSRVYEHSVCFRWHETSAHKATVFNVGSYCLRVNLESGNTEIIHYF